MTRFLALAALAGMAGLSGCGALGEAFRSNSDVVARAAGHELSVEKAAALIAKNPRLPLESGVVQAVADLWIDYILLAHAANSDPSLKSVDVSNLIQAAVDQEIVWKLRDEVITPDTVITEEQLQNQFVEDQPGSQIRARHILLPLPASEDAAARESARNEAERVRQRALAGADFAALAREFSQDPGSSAEGGDLGFFGRGQLLKEFEDAAFALGPGEISEVVQTDYGLHIIKVEERNDPDYEELKEWYREQAKRELLMEAEDAYLDSLMLPLDIRIHEAAGEVVRELARVPGKQLSRRAGARPLVSYKGGAFTAKDFQGWVQRMRPNQRGVYATASDEQLDASLRELLKNHLLIREARKHGFEVTNEERDSLEALARGRVEAAAVAAGLNQLEPQEDETLEQVIDRKVTTLLESIIAGEPRYIDIHPLVAFSMRRQYGSRVFERSFPFVLDLAETLQPPTFPGGGMGQMPEPF